MLREKEETVRKTQPEKDTKKMKGKIERKDRKDKERKRKEESSEEREMKVDIEASGKD